MVQLVTDAPWRLPFARSGLLPRFTVSGLDGGAIEARFLRKRGLSGLVMPIMLKAHWSTSCKIESHLEGLYCLVQGSGCPSMFHFGG